MEQTQLSPLGFITSPCRLHDHPLRLSFREHFTSAPNPLVTSVPGRRVPLRSYKPVAPIAAVIDAQSAGSASLSKEYPETIVRFFRRERNPQPHVQRAANALFGDQAVVEEETCFNISLRGILTEEMKVSLIWLLSETFDPDGLSPNSHFAFSDSVIEIGPRLNFQTAWSSNAITICKACGIDVIDRLERSRRYALRPASEPIELSEAVGKFAAVVHDRMTETVYEQPLSSFCSDIPGAPSYNVDILNVGRSALVSVSQREGLGFDEQDVDYYYQLFSSIGRNPTNVELFDLAQSNSEHSRHWFFKGQLIIDNEPAKMHLLDIVRETLRANRRNSVIAFADNSSTIRGCSVPTLVPSLPGAPGPLHLVERERDILFTAETHNFPSGVAPFPGAETGTGGRIRDTAATGIGSLVGAATAGYAVGNLHIPGHNLPWEDNTFHYPDNLASALDILIGASNGASDYGNKFGEPVINGFARSYGLRLPKGERREFVKPIMFSGGMGQIDHAHSYKGAADIGLLVVKVGGPAYRIGMGGGAASSMMHGDNQAELDFNAVQRGDAEMAQKVYRVLRACVELGSSNPIVSIHDQGAGGNCNVVKELIYPAGAKIDLRKVWVGDKSLSALEIWGAEYQEQFGLLLLPEHEDMFRTLCHRENVVPAILGAIDGSGRIILWDEYENKNVVDLDLEAVLGDLPQKTFIDKRLPIQAVPLQLPADATIPLILKRVLSLMTVGSKRFLTTKVDRSVTGLIAQQQCVGPLQLPLCGYAVTAQSYYSLRGSATAIGERPSLTSINAAAMARISVGEMLTNIAGVKLTAREDIKCEGNWMWAAKLPGDCSTLYDAAIAMRDIMIELGIAIDGGKDSLSMAAKCPTEEGGIETVRAPGTLVISGYCTVDDVRVKLTPDLKGHGNSKLLFVDIAQKRRRMGGSAVAQTFMQCGDVVPDVDNAKVLQAAFDTMQKFVGDERVLSYHDISDGGFLTAVLEMAFAGNCGIDILIDSKATHGNCISCLFAEELGMIVETASDSAAAICKQFVDAGVDCHIVGKSRADFNVSVMDSGINLLSGDIREWRDVWEATSFALERQQADLACVQQEQQGLYGKRGPKYVVPWKPHLRKTPTRKTERIPKVGIIREEGSNGDREMSVAFQLAGFEVWDVCMRDIASGRVRLAQFAGVAFVGGFSFADVLDSAKGWAGVVRMNEKVKAEFEEFFGRPHTFSLGVCNGCQLMALLGRVPGNSIDGEDNRVNEKSQPRFVRNISGRYESRFSTVSIEPNTPAIMLHGMGGARLGVWVAHGEGRAVFPDDSVFERVQKNGLAPIRYVDDSGTATSTYPHNPNGSTAGIAALCSQDGRHLAMMPHPERTVFKWQWPYISGELKNMDTSPWITMFQNAFDWVQRVGF